MRLWLVRHAAVPQAAGRCYGASDLAADPAQTAAVGSRLAAALPAELVVWCSPLQRCRALALELQASRPGLVVEHDERLAEMNFGDWEGRTWDDIGQAALDDWTADFAHHRPGGGESTSGFLGRVGQAMQEFTQCPAGDGLWITHAGIIKATQWLAAGGAAITRADQWPVHGVACGEWVVLDLPTGG